MLNSAIYSQVDSTALQLQTEYQQNTIVRELYSTLTDTVVNCTGISTLLQILPDPSEPQQVLSGTAREFLDTAGSTCICGGIFTILYNMIHTIVKCYSS